jgi:hypothetical protein
VLAPYLDEELTLLNGFGQQGSWIGRRTDNIVDGGASFD